MSTNTKSHQTIQAEQTIVQKRSRDENIYIYASQLYNFFSNVRIQHSNVQITSNVQNYSCIGRCHQEVRHESVRTSRYLARRVW